MPLNDEQQVLMLEWTEISQSILDRYADAWAAGDLSLSDYHRLFKREVKDLYLAAAWTARGSIEDTTFADYGRVGRRIRDQYAFMRDFFQEIEAGNLSLEQIKARGKLYASSAKQILERIGADESGIPTLPAYPADGSTQCRTNDKCTLRTEEVNGGFDIYWTLHPAEHCPDCLRRSGRSPLRVRFGRVTNPEVWD